ncbi:ATP synthase F0 subunit 8 (mitochondrion) [Pyxicephalus adspersus]|uniref:ATP synthase complex subunit 8 n=1 Tax=Pyxicephalus adspersus TaxID=30357 RepID=A0A5B8GYX4_PYXAD|nr:ATP synthase F0 subunit 8 [Pyxicephalus adspersus]QDW76103.1 ATP synthase F0 subunit 8 [Pyxicephalus adspersus]
MPQLVLDPWFLIFISSWVIFITLSINKVLNSTILNSFTHKHEKLLHSPWLWPWQ